MPLLYETGGYMLTWPRLLVTSDPAVQVRPNSCQLQHKSEHVDAQPLIWLYIASHAFIRLCSLHHCAPHMCRKCSTASLIVRV